MAGRLIIIDGNSLVHRAFYALPPSMRTKTGQQTNAVYGFLGMLFSVTEQYAPAYIGVAFDRKAKTFRHKMFDAYKAGRRKTPDELISQFPLLKDALHGLGIATLETDGFEADDILGAAARQANAQGIGAYVLTGDRDSLQLISGDTDVLLTRKGVSELERFDEAHLREVYGLAPAQITDLKGLMGDSSDNIPGVPGVGEKTALKLLGQYPTVEDIYENIDQLPANKLREKLIAGKDSAFLSKELATIITDVPVDISFDALRFSGFTEDALRRELEKLEFFSMMKRLGLEKEDAPELETHLVDTPEELERVVQAHMGMGELAFLLEDGSAFLSLDGEADYDVPLRQNMLDEGIEEAEVFAALRPMLEDAGMTKLLHGAKAMMHLAAEYGVHLDGECFDTMVAAYVLDPTRRDFKLEKVAGLYGAAGKAGALFQIREKQTAEIHKAGAGRILREIELPLVGVLYDMEQEGFRVDREALIRLGQRYAVKIDALAGEIHALAGDDTFNIASTKQLGAILFEKLGLPAYKRTKTGYSTDIEVLEGLYDQHPIIPLLIEYRQLTKLKSTYIDGLLQVVHPDGKVYTTFKQTATATGRISSAEPNLQNIPVRSDISHEIRQVFIPSVEENYIVSADYSQIELRVLAHIAGDANMKDAFIKDEDIHTRTASEVFGVPAGMVTPEMRSSAKAVNFGIVYGISDFGLAKNLGIPRYKAGEYISRYLEEFSGVREYMRRIVEDARREGYVQTMWGRVRYIHELTAANHNTRSFGERAAMNTPIQGTAADIIKAAMIGVSQEIRRRSLRSRLILQVHDELIVDAVPEELEEVKVLLREIMENACALSVPLKVNVAWGRTWAEAK